MDITTHDKPTKSDPVNKDQSDNSTKKSELTSELTESGYHSDNPTERESPSRLAAHYSGASMDDHSYGVRPNVAMNTEYNRQLAAGFHLLTDKTGRTSPSSSDESSSSSSDIVHSQTETTASDALDKTLEIGEDPIVESNTDNSASVEMGPTLSDILDDTVETGKVNQSTSEESIPDMVGREFRDKTNPEISEIHIHTVETEKLGSSKENISENIVNTGTEPTISDIIDRNVETEISKTSPIQENIRDDIVHTGTAPTISDMTDENGDTDIRGTSAAEENNSENIINTEAESISDITDTNMENETMRMSPFKENISDDIVCTGIAPTISDITDENFETRTTLQLPSADASGVIDLEKFITEADSISEITDMNEGNLMLRMSGFIEINNLVKFINTNMELTISDIIDKIEETEISDTSPSEKNEMDIINNTETAPTISNITDENVENDILGARLTEEKNLDNIVHTESAVSSTADQNVETEITFTSLSEKNQSESKFSNITDKNFEIYGTSPNDENNLNNVVCTETESISDMSDKSVETGISDTRQSQEKSSDNIVHAETEHTISDITENAVEIGMLGTSVSEETNSDNIVHSGTDSQISDITEKNVETGIMGTSPIEENNSENITRTQTEFATSSITGENVEISGAINSSEEDNLDNIVNTETDPTISEIPVNTVAAEKVDEESNSIKIVPTEAEPANIPDIVVETEKSGLKEDNSDDIVHSDVEPTIYGIPDVIVETEKPGTSHIEGSIPGNSAHTETEPTISNDTVETEKLGQSMENNLENIPQTESQSTISSIPVCAVEIEKVGSTPIEGSISDNLSGIETAPAFSDISDNIVKTEKLDQRPNEERRVRYRLSANPNLQTSIPDETMQKDFRKTENVDQHLFHSCFSYSGRLQRDLTSDSALLENTAIHPENVETDTDDEESIPENSINVEADTIVSGITGYVYDTEVVIACDENIIHTKAEPPISNIPGNKMETEISDSNVDLSISKMEQGISTDKNEAISDIAGEASEVLTAAPSLCMVVDSDPSLCAVVAEAQISISDMVPDETKKGAILLSSLNAEIENSCKKPDPISPGLQTSISVQTILEASRKTQKVGEKFSLGVLSIDAPIKEEKDGCKFSAIGEIPLQIETTHCSQDGSDSSKSDILPIEDTVEEQTSKSVKTECISVEKKICLLTMVEADINDRNSKDAIGNSFYKNIPIVMGNEESEDGNSKDAIGNSFYTDIPFIIENEEIFCMNEIGEKTERSILNEVSVSKNADKIGKKRDKSIVRGNADESGNVDEIRKRTEKSIVNEVFVSRNVEEPYKITTTYSVITRVIDCGSDQRTTSQDENVELENPASQFYATIPEQTSDRVSVNDGSDPTTVDLSASREHVITEDKETDVRPGDRHLPDGAPNEDLVIQSDNLDKSVPEPVKILDVKSTSGMISAERKAMDNCSMEEMLCRDLVTNANSQKNGIAGVASSETKHLGNGVPIGPDAATSTSEQMVERTRCSNVKLSNFFDMDEFSDSYVNEMVSMRQGLYPNFRETKRSKEGLRFYDIPSYLKDRIDEKSTKEFSPEDMQEQVRSSLAKLRDIQISTREEQLMTHTASEAIERPFMWRDFSSVVNRPSVGKGQFMSFDVYHKLTAKEPKKQLTVKEPKSLSKILIANDEHVELPKSGGNKTDVKGCSNQPPGHATLPQRSLYVDSPVTIQILPSEKIRILYPSDMPTPDDLMFLTDDEEDDETTGQEGGSTKQPSKKWDVRDDGKAEQRNDDEKLQPIGAGLQEARQKEILEMTCGLRRFEYINNESRCTPWINLVKKKVVGGPAPVAKKEEEYLLLGMILLIAILLLPMVIIAFDHGYVQLFPDWFYYVGLPAAVFIVACWLC